MPRLAVPSRTRAQSTPLSRTRNEDGERSGQSRARRGPKSVSASQTTFGSRSVSTVYVTLATELGLRDMRVDRHVHELVRTAILLPPDVADRDLVAELMQELGRLSVQL